MNSVNDAPVMARPSNKPRWTEGMVFIAKVISISTGERLRRIVVGPDGVTVYRRRLRLGSELWYTGDALPDQSGRQHFDRSLRYRTDGGGAPRNFIVQSSHKYALKSLRRQGLIVEDPAHPGGDVLMLSEALRNELTRWLEIDAELKAASLAEEAAAALSRSL